MGTSTSTDSCTLATNCSSSSDLLRMELGRAPPTPRARRSHRVTSRRIAREPEDEPGAGRNRGIEGQAAAVPGRDPAGDGEPQTGTPGARGARVVQAGEPLEDPFGVRGGHPGAVVDDRQLRAVRSLLERHRHPGPGMADGVADDVLDGAGQLVAVA